MLFPRFPSLLALCVLLSSLTYCHPKPPMEEYQTEKFELDAAPAAADGYPVEIFQGEFTTSEGGRFVVPFGHYLEGSWGSSGIGWGVGDPMQPAPDSLHLIWFAWAENQFYEARLAMPQRRIHALLKEGYWDRDKNQHDTYTTLLVCVLPKGGVAVWLQGHNKVLVGRYQAPASDYSWIAFNGGRNDNDRAQVVAEYQSKMLPHVRAEIAAGTVSPRQWDEYLTKYAWQLEAVAQDGKQLRPLRLYDYYISYLNAENTSYAPTKDPAPYLEALLKPRPKPVPEDFGLFVENQYGEKHEIRVDSLDEQETMAAFRALHAADAQAPITLSVAVDAHFRAATLTLRNQWKTVVLNKAVVKLFALD